MCLVLGCSGTGKTLLLKRLHQTWGRPIGELSTPPSTIPTVGTELVNLARRSGELTLREVGGCMAPIWHNYYKGCSALIFMMDMSNRTQVAASAVLLYQVLTEPKLSSAAVCVFLNKTDITGGMSLGEISSLLRLEQICAELRGRVTVLQGCATSGQGLTELTGWITANCKAAGS